MGDVVTLDLNQKTPRSRSEQKDELTRLTGRVFREVYESNIGAFVADVRIECRHMNNLRYKSWLLSKLDAYAVVQPLH